MGGRSLRYFTVLISIVTISIVMLEINIFKLLCKFMGVVVVEICYSLSRH